MKLKPWYDIVKPREDLRENKPMDASEFAVHLDKVRLGTAPADYTNPQRFFERTYLTENLTGLGAEVIRRLSGITTETSAVFNMSTQFGGGKTHALTMLYHIAKGGTGATKYNGVTKILEKSGIKEIPDKCTVAVFVGTEFDSVTGRGGDDGTPLRKTPWGEIAWQLGGEESFAKIAEHDATFTDPKGDVINNLLPHDLPCLILMDEILNYISTYRDRGYHNKLYNFIQALSETIRGRNNAVLVVSIPASELSYTDKDDADQQRLNNMLDRVAKPIILSVEAETSEIIRRRLFEWDERAVTKNGRILLPKDAQDVCKAYAEWVQEHKQQLPGLINPDLAREQFLATFPFHPMVVSVFERKWQTLPRFQQTRGILRLLALWVAKAYQEGYKGAHKDPLITLGTAPLEDPVFRAAVFEQLGETKLEPAVTTDIAGKKNAHAVQLDNEAEDAIKKDRLHRKAATAIFFESNGGQIGVEAQEASLPEIRLAVSGPNSDIGNVETVLDALTEACYYLNVVKTRYKFTLKENLNKRFADRRATVQNAQIDEVVKQEIQNIFGKKQFVERVFFPEKSIQVSDRPIVTFIVGDLSHTMDDEKSTLSIVENIIREYGSSARTFKSAVFWVLADSPQSIREEARKLLAWRTISDEVGELSLEESQRKQIYEYIKKAQRDLKESIWRSYKYICYLAKDNSLEKLDMGLVHSSSTGDGNPISNVLNRLSERGEVELGASPNFLLRNWPPAFKEWSTKSVRDAFYASPIFPRILNPDSVKETIARGVEQGLLAYVGKTNGNYNPFVFEESITSSGIDISDDMYIINSEVAKAYKEKNQQGLVQTPAQPDDPGTSTPFNPTEGNLPISDTPIQDRISSIKWSGEVPPQKWMNFYTKVLSRFAIGTSLNLTVHVEVKSEKGLSSQSVDDTKNALRELGLEDRIEDE